jgi:hypothetical protein
MSKKQQPKFQVQIKATVYFFAEITANTFEEALAEARNLGYQGLWDLPGDLIDTEFEIEGIDKA